VLVTARQFKGLGVTTSDDIPEIGAIEKVAVGLQANEFAKLPAPKENGGADGAVELSAALMHSSSPDGNGHHIENGEGAKAK
jgi:hypothetical protein